MEKNIKIPDTSGLTFEKVWLMFQESRIEAEKRSQEAEKRSADLENKAKERSLKLDRMMQETDRKIKKLSDLYGGVSEGIGYVAEDYFYNALKYEKKLDNIQYDTIERNNSASRGKIEQEFDIILYNSNKIAIVEVKQNYHLKDVDKFAEKILPKFRILYPQYDNFTITGAIAGMTMQPETKERAKELGLYILTQNQKTDSIQL